MWHEEPTGTAAAVENIASAWPSFLIASSSILVGSNIWKHVGDKGGCLCLFATPQGGPGGPDLIPQQHMETSICPQTRSSIPLRGSPVSVSAADARQALRSCRETSVLSGTRPRGLRKRFMAFTPPSKIVLVILRRR